MKPCVSVIIPVYGVEKLLPRCMDSVLTQSLSNIEIILVDDESPDNCPQMCDEYAKRDKRVKDKNKKNGGLGFARNSGLEIANINMKLLISFPSIFFSKAFINIML